MSAVKARIWKSPRSGRWCYAVRGHGLQVTGVRATWDAAIAKALAELRWMASDRAAWRWP